jgi:hypothetical protein
MRDRRRRDERSGAIVGRQQRRHRVPQILVMGTLPAEERCAGRGIELERAMKQVADLLVALRRHRALRGVSSR